MSVETFPYKYFSGANVTIDLNGENLIECAGISYSVTESNQPVYGYASHLYDVVLPGRRIIQGQFVVNTTFKEQHKTITKFLNQESFINETELFDIKIIFNDNKLKLSGCFIISKAQTIQISENVILEEYGFIARNISEGR